MDGPYVLIGNSAASLAAVDSIRRYDPRARIVLVNREPGPAYSRVALPYYVAGEMTLDDLLIRQAKDYANQGVELIDDAPVTAIDAEAHRIALADGRAIGYRKLLVATGSLCVTPPIRGLETITPHYLWTLDDAKRMRAAAEKARSAVVIGGGFIGMLIAEALRKLNMRLTIVEMASQLLPQLLDATGGGRFRQVVQDEGTTVRLGARVDAVHPRAGQVAVTLADGETLLADMVAIATGVKPNLSCAAEGPCTVNRGICVDDQLRTSCPDVYAAGDVAEAADFLSGESTIHAIWPTAVDQGRVAGVAMAGAKVRYPGSLGMNVVELFNVTLAQLGRFKEEPGDDVHVLGDGRGSLYRKIVLDRHGVIVGAMYVGDENGVSEMGVVHSMIKRRTKWKDVAERRDVKFSYASFVHTAAHHG